MKRLIVLSTLILLGTAVIAQDSGSKKDSRRARKEERRKRTNAITRQEEEGIIEYQKQSVFGLQLRTNGYGFFYELGRMQSPRLSNIYSIEATEIMHRKEKSSSSSTGFLLGNSYKFGKINNFYQVKLGYGKQYIFGQKGNKNGVAIIGSAQAGLAIGLQKPYYIQVNDDGIDRDIKYSPEDSALFLSNKIIGGAGFTKGWSEVKVRPGAFIKTALRFDFGAYNESITAVEIGMSLEGYSKKIEQMLMNKSKQFFYQAHVALVFGSRK